MIQRPVSFRSIEMARTDEIGDIGKDVNDRPRDTPEQAEGGE